MGGLFHGIGYYWELFVKLFKIKAFSIDGTITLGPGMAQIDILTLYPNPDAVYLSADEPDGAITTCVGDLNWVAARVTDLGFTLYANIQSNSCTINYIVQYDVDAVNPAKDK